MKKSFLLFVSIIWISMGCTKDIAKEADIFYEERNVSIIPIFFYKGEVFRTDTVYETLDGKFFQIDDVQIVLSNFIAVNGNDTVFTDSLFSKPQFAIASIKGGEFRAGKIPGGTYNGGYGMDLGVPYDTSEGAINYNPSMFRSEEALSNTSIYDAKLGQYNLVTVTGKTYNPLDTVDGFIPIHWKLRLPFEYEAPRTWFRFKNFNLKNQGVIRFEAYINLESIFDLEDIYTHPNIGEDVLDITDQQRVKALIDNLSINFN